jgi:predicted metal-dependent hydrolase
VTCQANFICLNRPVRLTRRRNARKISLRLAPDGRLFVSAPRQMKIAVIGKFLEEQALFIERENEKRQSAPFVPSGFYQGERLPFFGRVLELNYLLSTDGKEGGVLFLKSAGPVDRSFEKYLTGQKERERYIFYTKTSEVETNVRKAARLHYLALLKNELLCLADEIAKRLMPQVLKACPDAAVPVFTVKRLSASWGRCRPATGDITLNLTLALFDRKIVEAIVAHELCHLAVPGHHAKFYELLLFLCPYYREAVAGLKAAPYARIDPGFP